MKKNKSKSAAVDGEQAADIQIAPQALANLSDRLKVNLAKPTGGKSQKTESPKEKGKRQDKNGANGAAEEGLKPKKKDKKKKDKKNESRKSSVAQTGEGPKHATPRDPTNQVGNGPINARSSKQPPSQTEKSDLKANKKASKRKDANKPSGEGVSLLDEILALGGTKDDLELLQDVDTDEDIIEEAPKSGKKSTTNKMLQQELKEHLKSLGLTGKFPDADRDEEELEEEEEEEAEWTDEDTLPTTTKAKEAKKRALEPVKANVIDRPLQLSTTTVTKAETKSQGLQKRGKLKVEPQSIWHSVEIPTATSIERPNAEIIAHMQTRGKYLLQSEAEDYMNSSHITSSDRQFLSTIMTSGTQSDRLSALTLSITSSPLHCQKQLDALMNMAKKKSRNEAVQAIAAIKDLLIGNLLPDRKLVYFDKQPGLRANASDQELILWTFEDWLKSWYFQVLQIIEGLSMDPLPFVRNHMISYILELLRDKPEQEQLLLRLLVNKLGDSSKKIAAKTSYFILQLQSAHPQMKSIILHEMENLLFRPNTSIHAQYYTIITMNQTILTTRDTAVANRLVEVYFMLFVKLLRGVGTEETNQPKQNKKAKGQKKRRGAVNWDEVNQQEEEVNSKILSAVLTGVNRAFPFSKVEDDVFEKHMDILFMITHDANFNTAVQALILIYQVASAKQIVLDRLTTSSKQALYLNLLFKSLKSDTNTARVKAFIKRLIQITSMHSPGFICGTLFLLHELFNSQPDLKSLLTSNSTPSSYDARKRDPLFANAENSPLWELSPLLNHYHPTVQLYAENLLSPSQQATTKPDLALHTIKHFLDRFVYRNPKSKPTTRGSSLMQPLPGLDTSLILRIKGTALSEKAVNSEDWWRQQTNKIRPDEIFFHRYFVTKEEMEVKIARKRKRGDEEMDEDEIWEAIVKSSKEEGGDGEVDVDESDEEVEWSDDEELGEEDLAEMNEGVSDGEVDEDVDDEISGEEGDVDAFFDDEAEEDEAEIEEEEEIEEIEEIEEEEDEEDVEEDDEDVEEDEMSDEDMESDASGEGRFEFGDDESDIMASDEEVDIPTQQIKSDRSKKRKLKSLPTFASAEDYAHMLED